MLSAALPGSAQPVTNRPARPSKPAKQSKPTPPADWLEIRNWPAYPGAELVNQVFLSGDQLKQLAGQVPPDAQPHLRGLKQAAILGYRLAETAVIKDVIAFYEPRVLAAGYKLLQKDLSEPGEASAAYTGPNGGTLVITVESEGEPGRLLQIVSVKGSIGGLAGLGKVMKKRGGRNPEPAPASSGRTRKTSGAAARPAVQQPS
jgi:hypothetical protein